jgi:hypothetical protein
MRAPAIEQVIVIALAGTERQASRSAWSLRSWQAHLDKSAQALDENELETAADYDERAGTRPGRPPPTRAGARSSLGQLTINPWRQRCQHSAPTT